MFDNVYVPAEGGYFVSERHARIAEILQDYDPTIELAWIPPEKRDPGDKPFAVIHRPLGRPHYVICYSDDPDERLLARVFQNDTTKRDILSEIDAQNAAVRALELKAQMEAAEEREDLSRSILKSPKNSYRHNGVKYE